MCLNLIPFKDIRAYDLSDFELDIWRSTIVNVKFDEGYLIYDFRLVFNSNKYHESAPLWNSKLEIWMHLIFQGNSSSILILQVYCNYLTFY